MQPFTLGRRALLAGGAALAAGSGVAAIAPEPPLRRFMRVYASIDAETVWYWYSGTLEMAQPGAAVMPLAGIETLIRRAVQPRLDGDFDVVTWEANYIHGLDDPTPLDELLNPVTRAIVRPFHFREGMRTTRFDAARLRDGGSNGLVAQVRWRDGGAYTWLMRILHIDTPHGLDMVTWPCEASGARNRSGSFSTHCALSSDLRILELSNIPCSFNYEAIFGWLPWLEMGQRPGHLVWRANGCKLASLADLPPASRRGFEATRPAILSPGTPWTESVMMWDDFKRHRAPARCEG